MRGVGLLLDGVCAATVEDRYEPIGDDEYELHYRGACCGCGWASADEHDDSNPAPGRRARSCPARLVAVPVLARLGHDVPRAAQVQRWLVEVGDLYLALGLKDRYAPGCGGLIRTSRCPCGTRSHWSGGFFDVCAGLAEDAPVEQPAVQMGPS